MPSPQAGSRVHCSRCGGTHTLRSLADVWVRDGSRDRLAPPPPTALFVRCQDTLYLVAIGGMLVDTQVTPIC